MGKPNIVPIELFGSISLLSSLVSTELHKVLARFFSDFFFHFLFRRRFFLIRVSISGYDAILALNSFRFDDNNLIESCQ